MDTDIRCSVSNGRGITGDGEWVSESEIITLGDWRIVKEDKEHAE